VELECNDWVSDIRGTRNNLWRDFARKFYQKIAKGVVKIVCIPNKGKSMRI